MDMTNIEAIGIDEIQWQRGYNAGVPDRCPLQTAAVDRKETDGRLKRCLDSSVGLTKNEVSR